MFLSFRRLHPWFRAAFRPFAAALPLRRRKRGVMGEKRGDAERKRATFEQKRRVIGRQGGHAVGKAPAAGRKGREGEERGHGQGE